MLKSQVRARKPIILNELYKFWRAIKYPTTSLLMAIKSIWSRCKMLRDISPNISGGVCIWGWRLLTLCGFKKIQKQIQTGVAIFYFFKVNKDVCFTLENEKFKEASKSSFIPVFDVCKCLTTVVDMRVCSCLFLYISPVMDCQPVQEYQHLGYTQAHHDSGWRDKMITLKTEILNFRSTTLKKKQSINIYIYIYMSNLKIKKGTLFSL